MIDKRSITVRLLNINKALAPWDNCFDEFCKLKVMPKYRECRWLASQKAKGSGIRDKVAFE